MVLQIGSNSKIKSALKAKVGLTSEGYDPGPLIIVSLTPGDRKPSGLEQGMPYHNKSLPSPRTGNNNGQYLGQEKKEVVIPLPSRPSSEHQYNYNSRSGRMERIY